MSNSISSMSSVPSWENIKEKALENQNLNADVRVSPDAVQVNAPSMWQRFKVAIGWEKAPVYASREETLTNLREQFGLDFSHRLKSLIKETGIQTDSKEYEELVTDAMQSFTEITEQLKIAIETPTISTSEAIQKAHQGSLNTLALLREQFSKPQMIPQFCVTKEGKISVLQPAPHPENFVLSGGGVKAAAYVGWFKAAEKFGFLKNLKRIAGTSAGAITAAFIASGMSAEDFEKVSNRTSFWGILTGTSSNPVINTATKVETKGWLSCIGFSGTYAVDYINEEMVGSIKKYFSGFETKDNFREKIEKKIEEKSNNDNVEKEALLELYKKIASPSPREFFDSWFQKKPSTYMVTFKDLATLAKIDLRFKELTVTGYDVDQKKETYFNAQNFPDLPIAEAVRASMSLPVAFKPVLIHDEKMIDGGVGSNTPAEVFKDCSPDKTVVLKFENDGRFNQIVYDPKEGSTSESLVAKAKEQIEERVTGNSNFKKDFEEDEQKLRDAGPNAMMVAEGDLGVVSFSATPEQIHRAQREAEIRAMEAFSLRQNQAVDHLFDSLESAMEAMTSSELQSIITFYDFTPPTEDHRAMTQNLSKAERADIVEAAKKEFAIRKN